MRQAKERIREQIKSDAVNKNLNTGNQNKHIIGHSSNTGTKSPIYGDLSTAQELIIQYSGTGEPILKRNDEWNNRERVTIDRDIGIHINQDTGDRTTTNTFIIHYGKAGAHVVPAERQEQ